MAVHLSIREEQGKTDPQALATNLTQRVWAGTQNLSSKKQPNPFFWGKFAVHHIKKHCLKQSRSPN